MATGRALIQLNKLEVTTRSHVRSVMNQPIIQENISFKELGSYHIGGLVSHLATPRSEEELREVLKTQREHNWPVFVLGGGTNLLMNDGGFSGLMIRPDIFFIEQTGDVVRVGAGVLMANFLLYAIDHDLGGVEWAGGLPGTVGGAVRGNAGCFGSETKDRVISVESINLQTGEKITRENNQCEFEYRSSIFKTKFDGKEIITAATFQLFAQAADVSRITADQHSHYRKERQPLEYPNIGSIFKNVDARQFSAEFLNQFSSVIKQDPFPVIPAAYLISEAGLKNEKRGDAMISPKHPNFIVNTGDAKASDVKELIKITKEKVKEKFSLDLETEIIQI